MLLPFAVVFALAVAYLLERTRLWTDALLNIIYSSLLAIARGVSVSLHRTAFIVLLSLVVGISIKAIGVLLVSAFVVIPACAARLLSRTFTHYVVVSAGLGAMSAMVGMLISAGLNLPSGPSTGATQLVIFLFAMTLPHLHLLHR